MCCHRKCYFSFGKIPSICSTFLIIRKMKDTDYFGKRKYIQTSVKYYNFFKEILYSLTCEYIKWLGILIPITCPITHPMPSFPLGVAEVWHSGKEGTGFSEPSSGFHRQKNIKLSFLHPYPNSSKKEC